MTCDTNINPVLGASHGRQKITAEELKTALADDMDLLFTDVAEAMNSAFRLFSPEGTCGSDESCVIGRGNRQSPGMAR